MDNSSWEEIISDNIKQQLENFSSKYKYSNLGNIENQSEQLDIAEDNTCILHANDKNKLGYAILGCIYYFNNEIQASYKLIEIIPLW